MFDLLPWHQGLARAWRQRTHQPHAVLLHGPAGIGKQQLAAYWAACRLCLSSAGAPCGQCRACQLLGSGTHPDYFVLTPEESDKAIRVDQVRALVSFVETTPQMAKGKTVLIAPAEAMNVHAANALLKTLEEPAGDTQLILVSHQISLLLPTIRSRCVMQSCPEPTTEQALVWLAGQLPELTTSMQRELLALAKGAPLKAVQLHLQGGLDWLQLLVTDLHALHQGQLWPSALAERWAKVPTGILLDWFYDWTLWVLRCQMTAESASLNALGIVQPLLMPLIEASSAPQLLEFIAWLSEQRQADQARAPLNRVLLVEALLVRWSSLHERG